MSLRSEWRQNSFAVLILQCLLFAIQHHLVECVGQRLTASVRTGPIGARLDSGLRKLRDSPVFAVGSIPELNCVVGLEVWLAHFIGMEMPFADYIGAIDRTRP